MSGMIPSESHDISGVKGHVISHMGSHSHVTT